MLSCPKCSSLLRPKVEKGEKVLLCPCGYKKRKTGDTGIKEQVKGQRNIKVVEEIETRPLVDVECPKCGHQKAYFWSIQTRAADEPETRFFKCEKCKHTWREYK